MATVSSTLRATSTTLGSASAGPFNVGFRIFSTDLKVFIDGVETEDFTVAASFASGYSDNATVTLTTAQPSGTVVRIESHLPAARQEDYLASDRGLADKMNVELARLWSHGGDVDRDLARAPKVPFGTDLVDASLPAPTPSRILVGRADGKGWANGPVLGLDAIGASDITPQQFGAKADMTYEMQALRDSSGALTSSYGFVRTGGTDDRAAIVAADAAAAALGQPLVFPPGQYYIRGEVRPTTRWLSFTDFGATLWLHYDNDTSGRSTSGLAFFEPNTGLGVPGDHGFKLIGQFSRTTTKESGNGQLGTVWRINDYYMPTAQPILDGMHIRALVCRAALQRNSFGTITQRCISSIQGAAMAGMNRPRFQLGVFGKTNVTSTMPLLVHWGCRYDPDSIRIAGATVTAGGSGYTSAPTVTVVGGGGGVTATATAVATVSGGSVTAVTFTDWGAGYTERPTISFSGGGGAGAAATVLWGDDEATDKTVAQIVETYHAMDPLVEFITPLDNGDGHGLLQPFDLASTGGHARVYGVDCIGVGGGASGSVFGGALGSVSCGDVVDAYTCDEQAGRIWQAVDIYAPRAIGVNSASGSEQFYVKGVGEAKYGADSGDFEPGTRRLRQRQLKANVRLWDPYIRYDAAATAANQRSVFIDQVFGSVEIRRISSFGAEKAVELENSFGNFMIDGVSGNGAVLVNFANRVSLGDLRMDRGNSQNAGDTSAYAFGWGSDIGRGVEIAGTTDDHGTTSAEIVAGGVSIPLTTPLTVRVWTGQPIQVGNHTVNSVRMHRIGATAIDVTPFSATIASGTQVYGVRRSQVGDCEVASRSSRFGVDVNNSDVENLILTRLAYAGEAAARIRGDSHVRVGGGVLPTIGRLTASTPRTIKVEDTAHLHLDGVRIPDTDLTTHVLRNDSATLAVTYCVIEQPINVTSNASTTALKTTWRGNVKYDGTPALYRGHHDTWTPGLLIGGSSTGITYGSTPTGDFKFDPEMRLCRATFDLTLSSLGGLTGSLTLDAAAWPFAQAVGRVAYGTLTLTNAAIGTGAPFLFASGGDFWLQRQSDLGVTTLNEAMITDTSRIRGSITYEVA